MRFRPDKKCRESEWKLTAQHRETEVVKQTEQMQRSKRAEERRGEGGGGSLDKDREKDGISLSDSGGGGGNRQRLQGERDESQRGEKKKYGGATTNLSPKIL